MQKENLLNVALSQIAPVWLDKEATLQKIYTQIQKAAAKKTELIVFGEGVLPGYPFWLALADGAHWNTSLNKELYAHYLRNSITIENGDLDHICAFQPLLELSSSLLALFVSKTLVLWIVLENLVYTSSAYFSYC